MYSQIYIHRCIHKYARNEGKYVLYLWLHAIMKVARAEERDCTF